MSEKNSTSRGTNESPSSGKKEKVTSKGIPDGNMLLFQHVPVFSDAKCKILVLLSAFDSSEEKRIQEELDAFNAALEDEMTREQQRHQKNMDALSHRKEDMLKEKKKKLKVCNPRKTMLSCNF